MILKKSVYEHYLEIDTKSIFLTFNGTISQEILADIATNLRTKYYSEQNISKKLFAIFIEVAQNIYHHSADKEFSAAKNRDAGAGIMLIQDTEDHFVIAGGNLIDASEGDGLLKKCEHINSLGERELREFYKSQRRKPSGTATGGNIGLIDMARKSGNPLEFEIIKVDEEKSFFSLLVKIDKDDNQEDIL